MKACTKCKIEKQLAEFNKKSSNKDGLSIWCRSCASAASKKWAEENRERKNLTNKAWASANPKRMAILKKNWRESNAERSLENIKLWRESNKDRVRDKAKEWKELNRELVASKNKDWKSANPEKISTNRRNRRSRMMQSEGTHTAAEIRAIFESQKGLCANCKTKLFKSGKQKYHVDHIMPLALGGSNWPANLQCLCPSCNLSKGAKHPDEWAKQNGRLL